MRLRRPIVRCHYCDGTSSSGPRGVPVTWTCSECDAVNHLDQFGEITDPPSQDILEAPAVQYARSRSTSPLLSASIASPFCKTCQRNQLLLNKALAEYLPEEDDPEYMQYEAAIDQYRARLEDCYPQVCAVCQELVEVHIQAAEYAARADNLRRALEYSQQHQTIPSTRYQYLQLIVVRTAKWTYLLSAMMELAWHGYNYWLIGDHTSDSRASLDMMPLIRLQPNTRLAGYVIKIALLGELSTLWWHPKLKVSRLRSDTKLQGQQALFIFRTGVFAFRLTVCLRAVGLELGTKMLARPVDSHAILFGLTLCSAMLSWTLVRDRSGDGRIDMPSSRLRGSPKLRSSENSLQSIPLPNNTSFDTMAQSFTSTFMAADSDEMEPQLPPSPSLTAISTTTYDSDAETPFSRKNSARGVDRMDWTPTQKRFADQKSPVLSIPCGPLATPQHRSPHSLFARRDSNPFHHRVPAAPKAPLASKFDPWKLNTGALPLHGTTQSFFDDTDEQTGEHKGLHGIGVPKRVQKQAEMFREPKLKYDYYGNRKGDTGLESSFNNLLSE